MLVSHVIQAIPGHVIMVALGGDYTVYLRQVITEQVLETWHQLFV